MLGFQFDQIGSLETAVNGKVDASKFTFVTPTTRWSIFSDSGYKMLIIRGYYKTNTDNDSYVQAVLNSNDKTLKLVRKAGSGAETTLTTWTGS